MISVGAASYSNGKDEESLVETWSQRTAEEAKEILDQDDVKVTSDKDKKIQLPKLMELEEKLKAMEPTIPSWTDEARGSDSESESEQSADEESEESTTTAPSFKVGDRVRVKESVTSPQYGWGEVTHQSIGRIATLRDGDCNVDFPGQKGWTGRQSELEKVRPKTGDKVVLTENFTEISDADEGPLTPGEVGTVTNVSEKRIEVETESGSTWWYDEDAIRGALLTDDETVTLNERTCTPFSNLIITPECVSLLLIGEESI